MCTAGLIARGCVANEDLGHSKIAEIFALRPCLLATGIRSFAHRIRNLPGETCFLVPLVLTAPMAAWAADAKTVRVAVVNTPQLILPLDLAGDGPCIIFGQCAPRTSFEAGCCIALRKAERRVTSVYDDVQSRPALLLRNSPSYGRENVSQCCCHALENASSDTLIL